MSWWNVGAAAVSIGGNLLASKKSSDGAKAGQSAITDAVGKGTLLNLDTINTGNVARSTLAGLLGISTPKTKLPKEFQDDPVLSQLVSAGSRGNLDPSRIIENTPGFQMARDQATKSILANNSALGLRESGGSAAEIGRTVSEGLALPIYNSFLNRLEGLSGNAAAAASDVGRSQITGTALASGFGADAADARASGIAGAASTGSSLLQGLGGVFG